MQPRNDVLARGVSSGARLRRTPVLLQSAKGSMVTTEAGTQLVDYVLGMGPILLGHGRREVVESVQSQLERGELYGTTADEHELAARIVSFIPWAQKIAFVNTGSEATHLAVRIARVATGRQLILKFEGHYHGWIDPLFVNTQNNAPDRTSADEVNAEHAVAGLPPAPDVMVIRWNDPATLRRVFARHEGQIAAVIVEPIPMNFGVMQPSEEFMTALRDLCSSDGAQLIFDEVLSGFRLAKGGAAELLGVEPDIGVYAKAVANGFPLAVVAGTEAAMAPIVDGPMLPAGTYSGHPVSVQAALATLTVLERSAEELYAHLSMLGQRLAHGIEAAASELDVPLSVNQIGSVLQLFWGVSGRVTSFNQACMSDRVQVAELCERLEAQGMFVAPRGLILLSTAHTVTQMDDLIVAIRRVLSEMSGSQA